MDLLLDILSRITIPLVALIAVGYALERKLGVGSQPLGRLLIYAVLPAALVHFLTSAKLPLSAVSFTAIFAVGQFFILFAIGWVVGLALGLRATLRPIFALAVAFPNSGNYGIPLIELAFGADWILHQSVITSVHAMLIVIFVATLLSPERLSWRSVLRNSFQTPLLPAVIVGLGIKGAGITLPSAVAKPLAVMAGALTPVALITLGAQLAVVEWRAAWRPVATVTLLRLIAAPLLTWAALLWLGGGDTLAQVLVVGTCTPIAVLLAILVTQQHGESDFAAAAVVVTTALSPLAVTAVIALLSL
jgi:predicted permease